MKILFRAILALALLALLGLGALALLGPRLAKSDAVRQRIEAAGAEALGAEVRYRDLDFGLLPPRLLVLGPSVAGPRAGDPPLVEAERVALRVALLPLLIGTLVVDSLVVEGASLTLARTESGIELPLPPRPSPAAPPSPEAPAGSGAPLAIAVREVGLRDTTLVLVDRTVSPPVTWELRRLDASLRGRSLAEPFDVDLSFELASGGTLSVSGKAGLDANVDLEARLDALALAPLRAYLGGASELAGALSGSVALKGPASRPTSLVADLRLRDGQLRMDPMRLRGPLSIRAELAGPLATPTGHFDLDATDAQLDYGGAFHKPPGTAASVSGRIVTGPDGSPGIDDVKLKVRNLDATGSLQTGPRTRVVAKLPAVELRGWDELVPGLAGYGLSGAVRSDELVLRTAPLDLRGVVHLQDLRATAEGTPLLLRGALVAEGGAIRTRDVSLLAEDQAFAVEGALEGLAGKPRYRARLTTKGADTNRLVSAFAGKSDTLFGPLDVEGQLSGELGSAPSGSLDVQIDKGILRGISLLQAVLDGFRVPSVLALAQAFSGRDLPKELYGEEFDLLRGVLRLTPEDSGALLARELRLVYRHYEVDLQGRLRLADLGLEMKGSVSFDAQVDRALAGLLGGRTAGRRRTIPLASVGGTLDAPKVRPDPGAVTELVKSYALAPALEKAIGKGLESLGGDKGQAGPVLDALEGILRGRRRTADPPPQGSEPAPSQP